MNDERPGRPGRGEAATRGPCPASSGPPGGERPGEKGETEEKELNQDCWGRFRPSQNGRGPTPAPVRLIFSPAASGGGDAFGV